MVLDVGNRKQLFLEDNFIVESIVGIRYHMHQPVKHPKNPLIVADKPWEAFGLNYICGVMYDEEEKIYKMWYVAVPKTEKHVAHAYAISKDAINWIKPNLGLVEFNGSKENNIIYFDKPEVNVRVAGIIKDSIDKDSNKRYKMIFERLETEEPWDSLSVAFSSDGLRWNIHSERIWRDKRYFDTNNTVFWDPSINKYAAYVRRWIRYGSEVHSLGMGKRFIGRMESSDFIHWTTPEIVLGPDDKDPPFSDLYTPPAFKYTEAENVYFMLPSFFDWCRDQLWVQLAASRDGIHWYRVGNREPFICLGPPGAWDSEGVYACAPPLIINDELYFFYVAYNIGHDRSSEADYYYAGGIGAATLRLDGFISLDAGRIGGVITTKPLRFKGASLELNVNAHKGEVRVEILNEKGDESLPGYAMDDCDPITSDSIHHKVTWRGRSSLDALENENVRLRFYLKLAKIYAFKFE